jgi:hypothetical protein
MISGTGFFSIGIGRSFHSAIIPIKRPKFQGYPAGAADKRVMMKTRIVFESSFINWVG